MSKLLRSLTLGVVVTVVRCGRWWISVSVCVSLVLANCNASLGRGTCLSSLFLSAQTCRLVLLWLQL